MVNDSITNSTGDYSQEPVTANVRVVVRIRPLSTAESLANPQETIMLMEDPNENASNFDAAGEPQKTQRNPNKKDQLILGNKHCFTFDRIYGKQTAQSEIYENSIKSLIDRFLEGYHATVFAYGQTGSGKTYTMGSGMDDGGCLYGDSQGIIPHAMNDIFERLNRCENSSWQLFVSYVEIYNEDIKDLLCNQGSSNNGIPLVIREDTNGDIYLAGCTEEPIKTPLELLNALKRGSLCRTTGSTDMNLTSSRSHAILSLILRQEPSTVISANNTTNTSSVITSRFNFVDLAGSERLKRTRATGARAKEAININGGLLALGNVISALSTGRHRHVPYRDSKLTRLLQNALGGNSQTLMLACVSPSECDAHESLSTLQYAHRAKNIRNTLSKNLDANGSVFEVVQLKKLVMTLRQEIVALKSGRGNIEGSTRPNRSIPATSSSSLDILSILKEGSSPLARENAELKAQLAAVAANLNTSSSGTDPNSSDHATITILKGQLARIETRAGNSELQLRKTQEALTLATSKLNDQMMLQGKYEDQLANLQKALAAAKRGERDAVAKINSSTSSKPSVTGNNPIFSSSTPAVSHISAQARMTLLRQLESQVSLWKARYEELRYSLKGQSAQVNELSNLKTTVAGLKTEKTRIISSMTDELGKLRDALDRKEAQLKDLLLSEKSAREEAKRYRKSYEFQKSLHLKKNNNPLSGSSIGSKRPRSNLLGGNIGAQLSVHRHSSNRSPTVTVDEVGGTGRSSPSNRNRLTSRYDHNNNEKMESNQNEYEELDANDETHDDLQEDDNIVNDVDDDPMEIEDMRSSGISLLLPQKSRTSSSHIDRILNDTDRPVLLSPPRSPSCRSLMSLSKGSLITEVRKSLDASNLLDSNNKAKSSSYILGGNNFSSNDSTAFASNNIDGNVSVAYPTSLSSATLLERLRSNRRKTNESTIISQPSTVSTTRTLTLPFLTKDTKDLSTSNFKSTNPNLGTSNHGHPSSENIDTTNFKPT